MLNQIDVFSEVLQAIQKLSDSGENPTTYRDILNLAAPDPLSVLFARKDVLQSSDDLTIHFSARYLKDALARCKVISFADWASLDNVSDLWDRLRYQTIKPLERHDFEFIFYLGNTSRKSSFEVDEILDIIGDYSLSGKVTVVLTEREVSPLWNQLTGDNGIPLSFPDPDINNKGLRIFNSMDVHNLFIYSPDHSITIFSREGREEWIDSGINSLNINGQARDPFNIGYILGLLLQLGTIQSAALGSTLARAYLRHEVIPDLRSLLSYIENRISESEEQLVKVEAN